MPRLIYGILSLILGAMALLLPETKRMPLPRTMMTVESIPTSISQHFRRRRSIIVKKTIQSDKPRSTGPNTFNDSTSVVSGVRSVRPYDNQSTIHSIYELQELGQDDTVHSISNRYPSSRRMDSRNPIFYQPYHNTGINNDINRQQRPIAEDVEYNEDVDDDRTRLALQQRLSEQKRLAAAQNSIVHTDDDVIILPAKIQGTSIGRESLHDAASQLEITAQIQSGDVTGDRSLLTVTTDDPKDNINRNDNGSQSPRYQRTMSQDENYFSEHC
jgi:hypothetical protein